MSDVDPIIVAGDDGEILDESTESDRATLDEFGLVATDGGEPVDDVEIDQTADGAITFIKRPDGEGRVRVDTSTEFGGRIERIARQEGKTPEECVRDVIEEFVDDELGE